MQGLTQFIELIVTIDPDFSTEDISNVNQAILAFDDLYYFHSKKFAMKFDRLIILLQSFISGGITAEMYDLTHLLDFIIGVARKYPKLLKNKKERIGQLYKVAIDILAAVIQEPTPDWSNPPNGYKDDEGSDNDENMLSKQVLANVD